MYEADEQDDGGGAAPGLRKQVGDTRVDNLLVPAPDPKTSRPSAWDVTKDIVGKLWNAPNTALGLLYGGAGMVVGQARHLMGKQPAPGVHWRDNAFRFTNNPFGGAGALTLGNTTTWNGDPYDPNDQAWQAKAREEGHPIPDHERQHTYQGEQLGPLYLPSNLLGGLNALAHGENWWGKHNWNERGPQSNPPRPWAPRSTP